MFLFLVAAAGGFGWLFFLCWRRVKALEARVDELELEDKHLYRLKYASSAEVSPVDEPVGSDVDLVGAWAMEMERSGERVTDDIIAMQRRLWRESGL